MLFKARFAPLIERGAVTETWRAWSRPQAKAGGVYRIIGGGVIEVDAVERVPLAAADDGAARAAGFADAAALRAELTAHAPDIGDADLVFRVRFRYLGPDERRRPGDDPHLSSDDAAAIRARLSGHDERSPAGPWTAATLALIAEHPGRRAGDLAEMLGWERLPFKANVRKLKALGLTESLEVGYRLSPRGRAYLDWASGH